MDAKMPAKVPSTLTAPSVPLGTTLKFVTRYLDINKKIVGEGIATKA